MIQLNKILICVLILLFACLCKLSAQQEHKRIIDSLLPVINNYKEDTNKVKALAILSEAYCNVDHNKGIKLGEIGLALANSLNWQKGIALMNSALGKNYWSISNYVVCLEYKQKALAIFEKLKDYKNLINIYMDIGSTSYAQTNLQMALSYYLKALKLAEEVKADTILISGGHGILCDISMTYFALKDPQNCLSYLNKALNLNYKIHNPNEIAFVRRYIAEEFIAEKKYNEAIIYLSDSYNQFIQLKNANQAAYCQDAIARVLDEQKQFQDALNHYNLSLQLFKKCNEYNAYANTLSCMGESCIHHAKYLSQSPNKNDSVVLKETIAKAITFLKKALVIAGPVDDKINLSKMKKDLSDAYLIQGDYKMAFNILQEYLADKDSLNNIENDKLYNRKIINYEYQKKSDSLHYITELKNEEIKNLDQQNKLAKIKVKQQWLFGFILIIALLCILIFIIYRNKIKEERLQNEIIKEKYEKQITESELKNELNALSNSALRSQMNPHFIFNCLNSIRLYTEENDADKASFYLNKFSRLIRLMLDSNIVESSSLENEINLITLYLEMERMRLKNKLNFSISIDENIEIDYIKIPPLLLQPYVENAIWHGIMPKKEGGQISIDFNLIKNETYLLIKIQDNGIGRQKSGELNLQNSFKHISHGTRITGKRIDLINENFPNKAAINIKDLYENNRAVGTLVSIEIPL